jgi:uncharacterized protein YukE
MPDFLGLLLANPTLFVDAGTALEAAAGQVGEAGTAFGEATSGMPGWTGDARTAHDAAAKITGENGTQLAEALGRAGQALQSGGAMLAESTTVLREQVDMVLAEGYLVIASGLVVIGPAQEAEAAAATVGAPAVIAAYEAGAVAYTVDLELIVGEATTLDMETAAQIQLAGELIGLPTPGPSALRGTGPAHVVETWYQQGMPMGEFMRKARALQDLGDRNLLFKATNPVARDQSITRDYRSFTIGRIRGLYNTSNPAFRDSLIDDLTQNMSPDHVHELQVGGPDNRYNLKFLDRFTNEQIGKYQIWPQIRNLPDGTPIQIEVRGLA